MLRQRQRCGCKVALLRLLLGVPAAQSVLAAQAWALHSLAGVVTRWKRQTAQCALARVQITVPTHVGGRAG